MRTSMVSRLLAAFAVVAIAGCGSGGAQGPTPTRPPAGATGATAASAIDSCALLTDDEIHAGTGQGVSSRKPSTLTQVFSSVCDIDLDGGGSLTVSVLPTGGKSLYETSFEPFIGQANATLQAAIEGLGDKAGTGSDELMVLAGDTLFDILAFRTGRDDATARRYLAEVVLAKLPCLSSGCPGFTPPPAPSVAPATDVCSLLTAQDLESATKFHVVSHEAGGTPAEPNCTWTLDTGSVIDNWVELAVLSPGGKDKFNLWATAYSPPLEHVPGVGDDAIKTATIPGGAVYALVGDRLFTVSFSLPLEVDDPYALVVPLAKLAVTHG
ncbi:MAG TPA: hypothetical protein VF484_03175 [Candidatus Limnocylindrales bacterium]